SMVATCVWHGPFLPRAKGNEMTMLLGLSLTDRQVVFVGGGTVAARRMSRFLSEGARIRVVAPRLAPETAALVRQHGLAWVAREFAPGDLSDAWVVHTATGDSDVDRAVAAMCEARRVLCINASDGARGTARMTAQTASGDVVIGVSSDVGIDPRRAAG